MQSNTIRRSLVGVAAVVAAALGGTALAGAASKNSAAPSATPSQSAPSQGSGGPRQHGGRHVGANGIREQALSASDAAKVKAAALAKYPGATIERVETDADHGSPFEAHLTTASGEQLEVLVDSSYTVTASNSMQHP